MFPWLQIGAASVIGYEHREPLKEKNGHDAFYALLFPNTCFGNATVLLVADGCGSGAHSEVGSKIGIRLLAESIKRQLLRWQKTDDPPRMQFQKILERARQGLLARLRVLAEEMGGSYSQTVNDYFLFTVVGAIVTDEFSVFFNCGDGVIVVNGAEKWFEPGPGNAPTYLAYGIVETTLNLSSPTQLTLQVHQVLKTADLTSFLLGSDGLQYLRDARHRMVPGSDIVVGDLDQFWTQDRYFRNRDAVRRRLATINNGLIVPDWEGRSLVPHSGHLKDDTTLIVGRRISNEL